MSATSIQGGLSFDVREALLDALESIEDPLLAWGIFDGRMTEAEVEGTIAGLLETRGMPAELDDILDAMDDLKDCGLLIPVDGGFRTRMAESLRLTRTLRQLFPDRRTGTLTAWRGRPGLVDAIRFVRRPRHYPRRDVDASVLAAETTRSGSPQRVVFEALTSTGDTSWQLAGFQERATRELLGRLDDRQGGGAIVGAGTGSGKTLAFYLPAFTHLASELGGQSRTKVLALYPRNELLKDQLQSAVDQARDLIGPLAAAGERPIRIGALFGGVPKSNRKLTNRYGWDQVSDGIWRCPYLRCPEPTDRGRCRGDLVVRQGDLDGPVPTVTCADCRATLSSEIFTVTRSSMRADPPDMLFSSTEMLNRSLLDPQTAPVFGMDTHRGPDLVLLDEVHTYGGSSGAMTALTLRRWQSRVRSRPVFVGLSATLLDAPRFFGDLVGAHADQIADIQPDPDELVPEGAEYLCIVRSDPTSRTSVLSTSIQAAMLLGRTLDVRQAASATGASRGLFGTRTFLFTDDLDVNNRLYFDLLDAEGQRHRRRHNQPYKPSLAHLRSPSHGDVTERADAGQVWDMAERIGHGLAENNRLGIGRTTSQDAGLDETADIVVATSSLEVGVDDDAVGAVMQHKAPRDSASFLQRQGRAGRKRGTRPITTVVVSDYGRDREAFEGWDRLVDPVLDPSSLPVGNTHVLGMQAAAETLAWAATDVEDPRRMGNLWDALRGPWSNSANNLARATVRRRLEQALEDDRTRQSLARHLSHALSIDPPVVDDLLWRPPRPILLGLIPAMLRRLEDDWRVADSSTLEDAGASQPMPAFIPRALFSKLALPELVAELPQEDWQRTPPVEQLGVMQGIRELAPGRITKRFAVASDLQRAWVDPTNEDGLEVRAFVQLRQTDGVVSLDGAEIPLVRPLRIQATRPDENLTDSTHGRPRWTSLVVTRSDGLPVRMPTTSRLSKVIGTPEAYLHRDQRHAEVRRGAWAFDVSLKWRDGRERLTVVRLVDDGDPVALGAAFDVDALRLRPDLPSAETVWQGPHKRALRSEYLRDIVTGDERLVELAGPFQADRLVDLLLLTLAISLASESSDDVVTAWSSLSSDLSGALSEHVGLLLADPAHADEDVHAGGALGQDLRDLLADPEVVSRLESHASSLWRDPDEQATDWLRRRLLRTVGEAVLAGARLLCPEHDPEGLVVDLEPGGESSTVWISEEDVGGGGFLEALVDAINADPGRFVRLVHASVQPGPEDLVATSLHRTVEHAVVQGSAVQEAFANYRSAEGASALLGALHGVRGALKNSGIPATPSLVSSVANRLLRVGSDAGLDGTVRESIARWDDLEDRTDFEIPLRVWSLIDATADGVLDPRRHDRLQTVLWPRGSSIRNRRLTSYNPYQVAPAPAPDVLLNLIDEVEEAPVDVSTGWQEVAGRLSGNGEAWVKAPAAKPDELLDLLTTATVSPIDLGYLRMHARPSDVRMLDGDTLLTRLDLPDVGKHARGDATGVVEPDTRSRRINTSGRGPGPVRDVMHTVFVSELLQPSAPLWIVSAWLSDVVVVDNRGGELLSLYPGLPVRELRLVEVLTEIVSRGGSVEVAVRKHGHNRSIVGRLRELASRTQTGSLRVQERPDLHDKILASDRLLVEGSMNFTHRGAEVNEEGVRVSAHPSDVGEQRMELRSLFGAPS